AQIHSGCARGRESGRHRQGEGDRCRFDNEANQPLDEGDFAEAQAPTTTQKANRNSGAPICATTDAAATDTSSAAGCRVRPTACGTSETARQPPSTAGSGP